MLTHSPKEITQLLVACGDGDQAALAELTPLVHEELHRLAHHYMGDERAGVSDDKELTWSRSMSPLSRLPSSTSGKARLWSCVSLEA